MKNQVKYLGLLLFILLAHGNSWACEVCQKQQPKITQSITHGAGPQSNWDWVIIAVISAITLLTLMYSIKYLVKPSEDSADHIKQSILYSK